MAIGVKKIWIIWIRGRPKDDYYGKFFFESDNLARKTLLHILPILLW